MDTMPPDFDLLAALRVLLEERHVTLAVRRLNVTQPPFAPIYGKQREKFVEE